MTKTHYGPEVPELGDLARSVGGWRRLSEMAETNAGTLAAMAKGRRRLTRRVRQVLTDHGARPAGWRETVAAILAWAEQPPPRKRLTSYAGKAR